ncbi:MAG: bacteriorhodopsin, partial [Sphingomicrobium sp.]
IPFLYIVYELFVGLGDAVKRQPENARGLVNTARWLTFASWGFYPIVYMVPYTSLSGATTETALQIGYTLADLIAKAGVGVLIYLIAVRKSAIEYGDPGNLHEASQPAPTAAR